MSEVKFPGSEAHLAAWREKARIAREEILKALEMHGWVATSGAAIAQKTFQTAVGQKVAHAYLSSGDSFNRTLSGDYLSEGRNVLEPHGVLIPHAARFDMVVAHVSHFALSVDKVVAQTYAVRLL